MKSLSTHFRLMAKMVNKPVTEATMTKECPKNPVNGKHCWSAWTSEFHDLDGKCEGSYFLRRECAYCEEEQWA